MFRMFFGIYSGISSIFHLVYIPVFYLADSMISLAMVFDVGHVFSRFILQSRHMCSGVPVGAVLSSGEILFIFFAV